MDPATMMQLQAVVQELEKNSGGQNMQQDLFNQGQALSALSNMDPTVLQRLLASDPALQVREITSKESFVLI